MAEIRERLAYLGGLAEGLRVRDDSQEGKILGDLIAIVTDLAGELQDLRLAQHELEENVGEMFGEEEEPGEYAEMVCRHCGERIYFDRELLRDPSVELSCPNCGEVLQGGGLVAENYPEEEAEVY